MRNFTVALILLIAINGFSQNVSNPKNTTTYYLIRHAEKAMTDPKKRDPELTSEGKERAKKWAELLSKEKIDFVYSTDYDRTRSTAKPIAETMNLEIILYNPRELNTVDFQKKTKGKTTVIVGHSNTTPSFVNKIIGEDKYAPLEEDVYGKLFIVKITDGKITDLVKVID